MIATRLHELIENSAARSPDAAALSYGSQTLTYRELADLVAQCRSGLLSLQLQRADRVGVWLEKRFEFVAACFGASSAGGAFVPINPVLKAEQVGYIMADCNVSLLVTSVQRWGALQPVALGLRDLRHVVLTDLKADQPLPAVPEAAGFALHRWSDLLAAPLQAGHRVIDTDLLAILYTSGSTGKPKGVVLSHRNMVCGAQSVASYLGNHAGDTLLAALPLSFDAGFSQLTTAFHAGARVVLLNYLMPRDVLNAVVRERVTGLTAVPPLWIQLAQLEWPQSVHQHLRYLANTGGRMPGETLQALRQRLPQTAPFLMYGLTEAFRSTYLPPDQVDARPDSIGKAIPNAEILVLRADGTECDADEPGELVHRGALVGMGYWNDPDKTAERYKPLPAGVGGRLTGFQIPEVAVFSGDFVRRDAEGYLYFIGRRDEMIKTSGYRVSPMEIEEVLYKLDALGECAAFGLPHPVLGQSIAVVVTPRDSAQLTAEQVIAHCKAALPIYMVPAQVDVRPGPLPRNPNGKIDRKLLATEAGA